MLAISRAAARRIVEDYCNSIPFSDGEIFWKIRTYSRAGDATAEHRWWARLSETKRKDLKHLLKNFNLAPAFDRLLDFPGLWPPIRLGTLHRLLALHCDEVRQDYLPYSPLRCTNVVLPLGIVNLLKTFTHQVDEHTSWTRRLFYRCRYCK